MNQQDAPSKLRGIFSLRKLEIGEKRQIGDYYLDQFGELQLIDKEPSFFSRKIGKLMCPHYRVSRLKLFKENKIIKMIDNGRIVYK